MEALDRKFIITATSTQSGATHDERDSILLLAQDAAVEPTLAFYRSECQRLGADPAQLAGVDKLIGRLRDWRAANPEKIKTADIAAEHVDRITAPNESEREPEPEPVPAADTGDAPDGAAQA